MRSLLKKFIPLNIFNIHGVICCKNMHKHIDESVFTKSYNCFGAFNIADANMLITWGNISLSLAQLIKTKYDLMPKKRVIIHITGCNLSKDGIYQTQLLNNYNIIHPDCTINANDLKRISNEARLCLIS